MFTEHSDRLKGFKPWEMRNAAKSDEMRALFPCMPLDKMVDEFVTQVVSKKRAHQDK